MPPSQIMQPKSHSLEESSCKWTARIPLFQSSLKVIRQGRWLFQFADLFDDAPALKSQIEHGSRNSVASESFIRFKDSLRHYKQKQSKKWKVLNDTPEEEDTHRSWRRRVYEHTMPVHFTLSRWLRSGVNRWAYFSYHRRFYRLNFFIILTLSVSPDYYEGQGWLQNPQRQPSFYGPKSYFEFTTCWTPRSITTKLRDDFGILRELVKLTVLACNSNYIYIFCSNIYSTVEVRNSAPTKSVSCLTYTLLEKVTKWKKYRTLVLFARATI